MIAFWYEFASTYSYLAAERIEKEAAAAGVEVDWQPFLLGPIFAESGWRDSPFNIYATKGAYMWRDVAREAESRGLPFTRPSVFPRHSLLAARVAMVARDGGWVGDFTRAVFRANFAEDRDIADRAVIAGIVESCGGDPDAALAAAAGPEIKARLRDQVERARGLGIFGAPSFIVNGELFWGDDRLDRAIAAATRKDLTERA